MKKIYKIAKVEFKIQDWQAGKVPHIHVILPTESVRDTFKLKWELMSTFLPRNWSLVVPQCIKSLL